MRRRAAQSQNKFLKLITLPLRALSKASDAYVRSLTSCAGIGSYGAPAGPVYSHHIPMSFNATSTEDFRELLRAASAKSFETDVLLRHKDMMMMNHRSATLPKSCSMRPIYEDEPCDFGDDDAGCRRVCRPSRSHAVTNAITGHVF